MSLPFPEELLSAYLDGEVTPEEKLSVQQLLEEKPELQERLSELSEISQNVRELPRESAPNDFAQSILDNLEPQVARKPASSQIAPAKRSLIRQWSSSLVAVAVLFVVGMFLVNQQKQNDKTSIGQVGSHSTQPSQEMSMATAEGELEEIAFLKQDTSHSEKASGSLGLEDSEMSDQNSLALSAPPFAAADNYEDTSEAEAIQSPKVVSLDRQTIQKHLNSLSESPAVGEELSILVSSGDAPILVDFTVVDIQKSLGNLQVLLKNHSVEQIELEDQTAAKNFGSNEKLVAVYLNLEEPDLENVLNQVVALDATIIIDNGDQLAANTLGFKEEHDPKNAKPALAADPAPLQVSASEGNDLKPESMLASPEAPADSANGSLTFAEGHPQNFQFNFESVRRQNKEVTNKPLLDSTTLRVKENSSNELEKFVQRKLPPSPELPQVIDRPNSADRSGSPVGMNRSRSLPANDPAKKNTKQKKVKAVLILREGKEPLNPQ